MADYTPILDDEILPDSPGTSILFFRLRDNPQAIAEGAAGAPRVQIGALQRLTAGSEVRIRRDNPPTGTTGTALEFSLLQSGEIRVTFDRADSGTTITLRRWRGTNYIDIYVGDPATPQTFDVSVLPGDRITLTWTGSQPGSDGVINARMSTGGEDYFPVGVQAGSLEGNTYSA